MLLRTLYIWLVVYGAIESVTVLWRNGNYRYIINLLLLLLLTTAESVCKKNLEN